MCTLLRQASWTEQGPAAVAAAPSLRPSGTEHGATKRLQSETVCRISKMASAHEQLYEDALRHQNRVRERQEKGAKAQEERELSGATFKPSITSMGKQVTRPTDVFSSLYQEAGINARRQTRTAEQAEEERARGLTFTPVLATKQRSGDILKKSTRLADVYASGKPVEERILQMHRKTQESNDARQKRLMDDVYTFKPTLVSRPRRQSVAAEAPAGAGGGAMAAATAARAARASVPQDANANADATPPQSSKYVSEKEFQRYLASMEQRSRNARERRQQAVEKETRPSFAPQINKRSQDSSGVITRILSEKMAAGECIRASDFRVGQKSRSFAEYEQEATQPPSFTPRLDKRSIALASRSGARVAGAPRKVAHTQSARGESSALSAPSGLSEGDGGVGASASAGTDISELTFRPDISASQAVVSFAPAAEQYVDEDGRTVSFSPVKVYERLHLMDEKRAMLMDARRRLKKSTELDGCTFRPDTRSSRQSYGAVARSLRQGARRAQSAGKEAGRGLSPEDSLFLSNLEGAAPGLPPDTARARRIPTTVPQQNTLSVATPERIGRHSRVIIDNIMAVPTASVFANAARVLSARGERRNSDTVMYANASAGMRADADADANANAGAGTGADTNASTNTGADSTDTPADGAREGGSSSEVIAERTRESLVLSKSAFTRIAEDLVRLGYEDAERNIQEEVEPCAAGMDTGAGNPVVEGSASDNDACSEASGKLNQILRSSAVMVDGKPTRSHAKGMFAKLASFAPSHVAADLISHSKARDLELIKNFE